MDQVVERRHPIYWFDDGSLILDVATYRFKVHHTLVSRHSRFFSALSANQKIGRFKHSRLHAVEITLKVRAEDVEALLQHLYHDVPQQLDFPILHKMAGDVFESMFPNDPAAFTHNHPLYDALPLATEFNLRAARKAILYSLVTTTEFEVSESSVDPSNTDSARVLSAADSRICTALMTRLIEHFTPTLFTAPAASHMTCTDAFAGSWLPLVIQPAIENDGVYKPLETLQRIKEIDWEAHGLCSSCTIEKREEWTEEQRNIWDLIDSWLESN
ncbi:hypothetical protein BJ912DRAFT_1025103 [Pholiota molesta]|nr:hypothetical protein BJ912DRAFT_1025103 [Pholiota molesta]